MPFARHRGCDIHFVTSHQGETSNGRPCVTFIHGAGGCALSFARNVPHLKAQGYFVICITLRGWGSSRLDTDLCGGPELFSSDFLCGDVLAVLDQVDAATTALIGHSIGGFVCARVAVEAPERLTHLVFSCTFYGLVDNAGEITRYILEGPPLRDTIALEVRERWLDREHLSMVSRDETMGRTCFPKSPQNLSPRYQMYEPEGTWLFEAIGSVNTQVQQLNLKSRFRNLHLEGAVTPRSLREKFRGPVHFLTTECDSSVHWEMVAFACSEVEGAFVHFLEGELHHAPYWEDPAQYNRILETVLELPLPSAATCVPDMGTSVI